MNPRVLPCKERPMATLAGAPSRGQPLAKSVAAALPWYVAAALVAATSAKVGVIWDISWHRSIGRDTFWTPAHMAIYLGGVLAGLACGWLVLRTTFAGDREDRAATVGFWGFRGPLGAWVCIWGALAMISSAPFDDWWHNAYGLDVKILSPPHIALAVGLIALHVGALVMLAGAVNTSEGSRRRTLEVLVIVVAGNMVVGMLTLFMEKTVRPFMHLGSFYFIVGSIVPLLMAAAQGASGRRWAGSSAVLVYSVFLLALLWTF